MDENFWREVERARNMTSDERISEGFRMFEREREARLAELQAQFPDATPEQVREMFRAELDAQRREKHAFIDKYGILP
jgi:hypothetical protein